MENKMVKVGLVIWGLWMLFLGYIHHLRVVRQRDQVIATLRQRHYNDSLLLDEYQRAMSVTIKDNPAVADGFSKVMDSINTQ